MKINYSIYNGDTAPSDKFLFWIKGWWFFTEGLTVEKGTLPNGDNWLLIGEFYTQEQVEEVIKQFILTNGDCLFKADGEYVLAINSSSNDSEVRIFRDRTGLLPLNYLKGKNGNILICLSLNNLEEVIEIIKKPSQAIVEQWPLFRGLIPPESLIEGVNVLSGRYNLRIVKQKIFLEERKFPVLGKRRYRSLKHASVDLGQSFSQAVKKRIDIKKKIGATLSGGNDSSLLLAVLRKYFQKDLRTVFVTFEDYQRNYGQDARRVAKKYNTNHSEIVLSPEEYFNLWAETIFACQSPINHPCTIGQTAAFKILANDVDTVFSGKGADTVFGGPFWAPLLFLSRTSNLLSGSIRNKLKWLASKIHSDALPAKIISKSLDALGTPVREYIFSEITFGDQSEVEKVFKPGIWEKTINSCQKFIKEDPLTDLFFFDVLDWHPITYDAEKKLCFYYGLTPLYPFLDYELMVNSLRLPVHLRYHYLTKKASLKKYSQLFFENKFIYKPKEGFGVPLGKWFSKTKYASFLNLPLEERSLRRGWWNEKELKKIIKYHQTGQGTDHSAEGIPWIVINLELWARICLEGDSPKLYVT